MILVIFIILDCPNSGLYHHDVATPYPGDALPSYHHHHDHHHGDPYHDSCHDHHPKLPKFLFIIMT